jgi:hypothetical protein
VMRRLQQDPVAQTLDLPGPVVRGAPVQEHAGTGGSLRSLRAPLNAGLLDGGRRSTATAWTTRISALETSRQKHPLSCERRYSKSKQHRNVTRGKS